MKKLEKALSKMIKRLVSSYQLTRLRVFKIYFQSTVAERNR